jgi:predicted RNase H-like nuclease (RuvC/YqgF family)
VKETTELTDKVQQQEGQLREYEGTVLSAHEQINALQRQIEELQERELRLQAGWQESIHSAEAMAAGWEDRCRQFESRLQEKDSHIDELKEISQKYEKVEKLWLHLNELFGDKNHPLSISGGVEEAGNEEIPRYPQFHSNPFE